MAYPSWSHVQVTDSLNHFKKLRVKWHPDIGMAKETDGTIASPWSGLHFLVLSGARVCLPVGYGSDGRLSLSRLLPGKPPSIWKQKGRPPGSLEKKKIKNGDFIDDNSSYSLSFVGLCVSN